MGKQADLSLCYLYALKKCFSLGAVQIEKKKTTKKNC